LFSVASDRSVALWTIRSVPRRRRGSARGLVGNNNEVAGGHASHARSGPSRSLRRSVTIALDRVFSKSHCQIAVAPHGHTPRRGVRRVGLGDSVLAGDPNDPRVAWLAPKSGVGRREIGPRFESECRLHPSPAYPVVPDPYLGIGR
jgi:hypothetical protein